MSGLDSLVARSLITTIEENLGEKTFQRIEKRLFERYGINMTQAAEHFTKLDEVMREFFGSGAEGLERQCLQKVITLQKAEAEALEWFTVENHSLAKVILEALGDKDKDAIHYTQKTWYRNNTEKNGKTVFWENETPYRLKNKMMAIVFFILIL